MAIIKTKSIYNVKNIHLTHHGYRTVGSILRANSANKFCIFLIIKTQKKKCLLNSS
jgi:vancomycin permeability regulator SanA